MAFSTVTVRDVQGRFFERLEGAFDKTWVSKVGMLFNSDQAIETYGWLSQTPAVRQWIGSRLAKQLRENRLTIPNLLFESTIGVDVDDMRREKTGQLDIRISGLATRVIDHWDKLVSTFILNGDGATSALAYDGQYFFDTDHSEGDSGSQKNLLTNSEVTSLNVSTATAPTAAEMSAAILDSIAYMSGFVDDAGEPVNGNARQFIVMTPTSLYSSAVAATANQYLANGVTNTLLNSGFSIQAVANSRLNAWTDKFCIFRTDGDTKPFILQEEIAPEMSIIGPGSETEFRENRYEFGVKASRNVGYGQWQHAVRCTLS